MSTMPLALDGYTDLPAGKLANVVTYLERRAPPTDAAAPLPPGCAVRRVAEPGNDGYRALFRRVGEEWLWTSVLLMDDAALAARIRAPSAAIHVMERDGDAIGFFELDRSVPGTVEIVLFGVVPEATGTGLAHLMMEQALREAFAGGTGRVWLHTCSFDHPRAVAFYRRAGFAPTRFAIEVMDDPRPAVLPASAAPHVAFIPPTTDQDAPRQAAAAWWER